MIGWKCLFLICWRCSLSDWPKVVLLPSVKYLSFSLLTKQKLGEREEATCQILTQVWWLEWERYSWDIPDIFLTYSWDTPCPGPHRVPTGPTRSQDFSSIYGNIWKTSKGEQAYYTQGKMKQKYKNETKKFRIEAMGHKEQKRVDFCIKALFFTTELWHLAIHAWWLKTIRGRPR